MHFVRFVGSAGSIQNRDCRSLPHSACRTWYKQLPAAVRRCRRSGPQHEQLLTVHCPPSNSQQQECFSSSSSPPSSQHLLRSPSPRGTGARTGEAKAIADCEHSSNSSTPPPTSTVLTTILLVSEHDPLLTRHPVLEKPRLSLTPREKRTGEAKVITLQSP